MEKILRILAVELRDIFVHAGLDKEAVTEIRLRTGQPLFVRTQGEEVFLARSGKKAATIKEAYCVSRANMRETVEHISNYSMYAFEEELRRGYITIEGGHRIGICGRTVLEQGKIRSMKYISGLNIRIAHEKKGCANLLLPYLKENGRLVHTLILAPPGCGKTTMLRDIVRQISDAGTTVGIVDERSELAACWQGIAQFDVGMRTDVLDGCPKAEGMLLLIRSMAPEVVAVDEIGAQEELHALRYAICCGCQILATVHAGGMEELREKPVLREMVRDEVFERYVLLERVQKECRVKEITDSKGRKRYG